MQGLGPQITPGMQHFSGVLDAPVDFTPLGEINVETYLASSAAYASVTAAIQAALDVAGVSKFAVIFSGGKDYTVTGLTVNFPLEMRGHDASTAGTRILGTANQPVLQINAACTVRNMAILGAENPAFTLQDAIFINGVNNVKLQDLFLDSAYNLLHIDGASFYSRCRGVDFYGCSNAQLLTSGSVASGWAWQFTDCQWIPPSGNKPAYAAWLDNIGSVNMVNCVMSPQNAGQFVINSLAANAGVSFFVECVFETNPSGAGVTLNGTSGAPIKFMYFIGCYIAGQGSPPKAALQLFYARDCHFVGCYLTGVRGVRFVGSVTYCSFDFREYQLTDVCFAADTGATFDHIEIDHVNYQGASNFFYVPNLTAAQTGNFTIRGTSIGTNATPVSANQTAGKTQKVDVPGFNKGSLAPFTLPASGTAWLNPYYVDVDLYFSGGTGVSFNVAGANTGQTAGLIRVPAGQTMTPTYTTAPTLNAVIGY